MAHKEQDIWKIISTVLENNPSPEEKEIFERWIRENSQNRDIFNILSQVGYTGDLDHIRSAKDPIFKKIVNKVEIENKRRKIRLIRYVAAASIAVLLGISGLLFLHTNKSPEYVENYVLSGKISRITLPDGTTVNLNSCSRLKYPKSFKGQKVRAVQLEGEAYFEVAKDSRHPFIVSTGSIDIKVLGTHFNVKAYPDESLITATLMEGSITVSDKGSVHKELKLVPNQQAIFNKMNHSFKIQNVEAALYSEWNNGNYYFDRDSLTNIFKQLERIYNIRIINHSAYLKSQIFSGAISNNDDIREILDIMKNYKSFGYKTYRDSIVLFDK